jgi:type VI secretion system protein ImpH
LPGRPAAVALRKLLGLFGEPALVYEIALVLKAQEVRPARLSGAGARLGLDSFVVDGPAMHERTDMRYSIRPLAPLRSNA